MELSIRVAINANSVYINHCGNQTGLTKNHNNHMNRMTSNVLPHQLLSKQSDHTFLLPQPRQANPTLR